MPKLHEVLAVGLGKKAEAEKAVTDSYHVIQKADLFDGVRKTYRPAAEDGERLPAEAKNIQHRLPDLIRAVCDKWVGLFDVTLTMDAGNQIARADVVCEGMPTLKNVPVPTLLFLEKQLDNVRAFVDKLPTPDPAEVWVRDANQNMLATAPTETYRTKKTPKVLVKYPATPEHPAQTEMVQEDVVAGYWTTIKYTTRVPADAKAAMLVRVDRLRDAVKVARERANAAEVERRTMGAELIGFVFGDAGK